MPCLDGIRVIAALSIVAHHYAWFANASNQDPMAQQINGILNAFRFSLDTFFVMAALLATNKMFHELSKLVKINFEFSLHY